MKQVTKMYIDLWSWTKESWGSEKKEVIKLYGGMTFLIFLFWFLFNIVLPIIEP